MKKKTRIYFVEKDEVVVVSGKKGAMNVITTHNLYPPHEYTWDVSDANSSELKWLAKALKTNKWH